MNGFVAVFVGVLWFPWDLTLGCCLVGLLFGLCCLDCLRCALNVLFFGVGIVTAWWVYGC